PPHLCLRRPAFGHYDIRGAYVQQPRRDAGALHLDVGPRPDRRLRRATDCCATDGGAGTLDAGAAWPRPRRTRLLAPQAVTDSASAQTPLPRSFRFVRVGAPFIE